MKKLLVILLVLVGFNGYTQNIHVPSAFATLEQFGGVPDGITDNSTAWTNAINYFIARKGGDLFITGGRWYFGSKIQIPVNCPMHVHGVAPVNQNVTAGFGADSAFGGSQFVTNITADSFLVNKANGTIIENLGIRCTSTTVSTTNVGLTMDSTNYCRVYNVWIDNFNQDVYTYGGIFFRMLNCTFRNGHTYQAQINGYPGDEEAGDSRIQDCLFDVTDNTRAGSDTGLNYVGAGGLQVYHCKFSGGVRPVHVAPWLAFSDFHFDDNSVENFTGSGTAFDMVVNGSVGIGYMSNFQMLDNQFYGYVVGAPVVYIDAHASAGFVGNSLIDGNIYSSSAGDTAIYINNPNAGADLNIGPSNKYAPEATCIPYAGNITLSGEGGVPIGRVTLAEGRKIICDLRQARNFLISGAMTGNDTLNIIGGVPGEPFAITCTQGTGNYEFLLNYDGTSTTNQVGVSQFVINPSPTSGVTTIIYGYSTGIASANITGINYYSAPINIYNTNGTLTGNRTVTLGGHTLAFSGLVGPPSTYTAIVHSTASDSGTYIVPMASGSFTCTPSNTTNVSAAAITDETYSVSNQVVTVTIAGTVTVTTGLINSEITLTLPIATTQTGAHNYGPAMVVNTSASPNQYAPGIIQFTSSTTVGLFFVAPTTAAAGTIFTTTFQYHL